MHPLGVLGQQRHVGVHLTRVVVADRLPAERGALALVPGARREVALHADDRLDPVRLGLAPELVGAEDVAVVRHRQRRHPHPGGLREQGVQPGRTVEHRELGVRVQVDEAVTGGACHEVVCSVLTRCRRAARARDLGSVIWGRISGEGRQTNAGVRQFRAAGADRRSARSADAGSSSPAPGREGHVPGAVHDAWRACDVRRRKPLACGGPGRHHPARVLRVPLRVARPARGAAPRRHPAAHVPRLPAAVRRRHRVLPRRDGRLRRGARSSSTR